MLKQKTSNAAVWVVLIVTLLNLFVGYAILGWVDEDGKNLVNRAFKVKRAPWYSNLDAASSLTNHLDIEAEYAH